MCVLSCSVISDLCNPMDYRLPGSSVHGIFQARILEWITISSSREYSQLRDQSHFSIEGKLFITEQLGKHPYYTLNSKSQYVRFFFFFKQKQHINDSFPELYLLWSFNLWVIKCFILRHYSCYIFGAAFAFSIPISTNFWWTFISLQ